MNDKLQEKLAEILEWAEKAVSTTSGFVAEQTPIFIQELLTYNFVISLSWFCLGSLLVLIACQRVYSTFFGGLSEETWAKPNGYLTNHGARAVISIISIVVFAVIGVPVVFQNTEWVKIKLAPRVYVVDYLRSELKK